MKKMKSRRINGILSKHKKGFGFVIPENKEDTGGCDVFIPPDEIRSAMDKDQVSVTIVSVGGNGKKIEGRIDSILNRATTEVVGTFISSRGEGIVKPDASRMMEEVLVKKKDYNGAKNGDKVVAKISRWPSKGRKTEGKIVEIISRSGEAMGDIRTLIRAFQFEEEFPPNVIQAAAAVSEQTPIKVDGTRRDLRDMTLFTIDGADAKDLDDAISIEKMQNGRYRLGVHIADVSQYVREKSPLDKEALRRGTSVYLLDIVLPMLPAILSNGACSLNPNIDRLALSVVMDIDGKGNVRDHEIFESLICSKERLVYADVSDLLENQDEELTKGYREILPDLLAMKELAEILRQKRKERGSLDFDFDEAHITLDSEGIPVQVELTERRIANRMIEEFMLIANETVAEHFFHLGLPFLYRVHERPSPEKIDAFKRFLQTMGLRLKGSTENIHPRAFNDILAQVEGEKFERVVSTVMLRSMKKAFYGVESLGHFGLGVGYYSHFTSPIRRYPDLMIHRIIKEALRGPIDKDRIKALERLTKEAAEKSSLAERKAEELEREVEKLKKVEYMSYHVGEEWDGIISGVASFGFFVELPNAIEGLVRLDHLPGDEYIFEQELYRFYGKRTRKIFTLGDQVRVRTAGVDVERREIDFELIESKTAREEGKKN